MSPRAYRPRTGGLEALETFNSDPEPFDLIITDMAMPEMTGSRLARKILSIKPDVPIIICTGYSERINEKNAGDIGIKGFLRKPFDMSQMTKIVRKILDETKT